MGAVHFLFKKRAFFLCKWGVKIGWIFFDRIRDRICLEGFRSVHIRVRVFNIRYRIHIRILKSHIYDVDIKSYPIRHGWHYSYLNPNPDRNIKTNIISVISVRIRSVFIRKQGPVWIVVSSYHTWHVCGGRIARQQLRQKLQNAEAWCLHFYGKPNMQHILAPNQTLD